MAGGRKQQKKKRKKSWRAVLEGCFHRPTFGSTKGPDSPDTPTPDPRVPSPQRSAPKPPQTLPSVESIASDPQQGETVRLRGILKKSPSISPCSSPLYAEACPDVPHPLSEAVSSSSGPRTAMLSGDKSEHDNAKSVCGSEFGSQRYIYEDPHDPSVGADCYEERSSFRPYSNSDNRLGYAGAVATGPHSKIDQGMKLSYPKRYSQPYNHYGHSYLNTSSESIPSRFHPSYDTYNESYEALRDRLQRRCQGQSRTSSDSTGSAVLPYASQQKLFSGSRPQDHDPEVIYSKPLPLSNIDLTSPLTISADAEETYVQLHEIQKRKQQQRSQNARPVSAPPASWHGRCIMESQANKDNPKPVACDRLNATLSSSDDRETFHDDFLTASPGRYITSALPRSRDPIRKPMGSQYCPYTAALCQTVLSEDLARGFLPQRATDLDSRGHHGDRRGAEPETLEVSHIYATVTRTSTKTTASSYIYASISWKGNRKRDWFAENSEHAQGLRHSRQPPLPPPIPPRHWTSQDNAHRPPLPTYDEVIESRCRAVRGRPVSWSDFSHYKVPHLLVNLPSSYLPPLCSLPTSRRCKDKASPQLTTIDRS